jgi:hypothetical protein
MNARPVVLLVITGERGVTAVVAAMEAAAAAAGVVLVAITGGLGVAAVVAAMAAAAAAGGVVMLPVLPVLSTGEWASLCSSQSARCKLMVQGWGGIVRGAVLLLLLLLLVVVLLLKGLAMPLLGCVSPPILSSSDEFMLRAGYGLLEAGSGERGCSMAWPIVQAAALVVVGEGVGRVFVVVVVVIRG